MERGCYPGVAGKSPEEEHPSHDSLLAYSNDAELGDLGNLST